MGNNLPPPADLEELKALGAAGHLWTVEIQYADEHEVKKIQKRNQKHAEVMKLRYDLFIYGILVPVELGHYRIICPIDIRGVDLYRQSAYFPE